MSLFPKSWPLKDGSKCNIREAMPSDAEAVIRMVKSILSTADFVLTRAEEFKYTIEEEAAILEKHQQSEGSIYLVAEKNEKLIGNLVFSNGNKQRNQHQGEFAMGVVPDFRKQGVGSVLLESFLEWAEENPIIKKVKLQVAIQNYNAIHLYRNLGFMQEGRLIKDIQTDDGEFMDLLAMYKFV